MKESATIRALKIIRDYRRENGPERIRPSEFAWRMWPESPGWKRVHKCGPYGSSRGAMMPKVGGGFLGKLQARGLITWSHGLTLAAEKLLEDAQ